MDARLRQVLRQHQQDPCPDRVLVELARAGTTYDSIWDATKQALKHVFLELLDYKGDGFVDQTAPPWPWIDGVNYAVLYGKMLERTCGPALPWLSESDQTEWKTIDPWTIADLHVQQKVMHEVPIGYQAMRAATTTSLKIWIPSQLDILKNGKIDDIRFVVSADIKDRSEVIGTLQEQFPNGLVISNQMYQLQAERGDLHCHHSPLGNHRPERGPKDCTEDCL